MGVAILLALVLFKRVPERWWDWLKEKTLTGGNVLCLHTAVSALRYVCMSCFSLRLPVRLAVAFLAAIAMSQLYLAETAQSPVALPRLRGLDRVYFEHLAGPGDLLAVSQNVGLALPEKTQSPITNKNPQSGSDEDDTPDTKVRDFSLPVQQGLGRLLLRQVIQGSETSRIADLWWALYVNGRRSDVWYFRADPDRTENKRLCNYEIHQVEVLSHGSLKLRVLGTMYRPQGAWEVSMKILHFHIRGNALDLFRVRTEFYIARGYDLGEAPPQIGVLTEREVDGRFEIRTRENVIEKDFRDCGLRGELPDAMFDRNGKVKSSTVSATATCVTQKGPSQLSYRGLNDPSFAERDGEAPRWK